MWVSANNKWLTCPLCSGVTPFPTTGPVESRSTEASAEWVLLLSCRDVFGSDIPNSRFKDAAIFLRSSLAATTLALRRTELLTERRNDWVLLMLRASIPSDRTVGCIKTIDLV